MERTMETANTTFRPLDRKALQEGFVVPQALDNVWVPDRMLKDMLAKRLCLADVAKERDRCVRTEYLRALINEPQLVINRAFMYNNPAVFQDYAQEGPDKEAFKELLRQEAVVTYLYNEKFPTDKPDFERNPVGWAVWTHLCAELDIPCVRLSWDEAANGEWCWERLSKRFGDFPFGAPLDHVAYWAEQLGLAEDQLNDFRRRLLEMLDACLSLPVDAIDLRRRITRNRLYKWFVVNDDTDPVDGRFESSKPFAREIKLLLDLRYNANLPDALGGHLLTPAGSPRRALLQERSGFADPANVIDLIDSLRELAHTRVTKRFDLPEITSLTLEDVLRLRTTPEWTKYIKAVRTLRQHAGAFGGTKVGVMAVYERYAALARRLGELCPNRPTKLWAPVIKLTFAVGGLSMTLAITDEGVVTEPAVGSISPAVYQPGLGLTARLTIGGLNDEDTSALQTSFDFLHRSLRSPREEWDALTRQARELPSLLHGALPRGRGAHVSHSEVG